MLHWYVMHAKPQKELFLFKQLNLNQIESYLPLATNNGHFRLGGMKPFFPGYLFVRVDIATSGISQLLWIPGSKGIVCFGGEPASVSDGFILQLKIKMGSINSEPGSRMQRYHDGDPVTISSGPFEGFQAVFNEYLPAQDRVRLLLKTIADSCIRLEVPAGQLAA